MKILYPIHLDRWRSPIASLLREVALRNADLDFYSFSSPVTQEDQSEAAVFWDRPNIHVISIPEALVSRFDLVHHASSTPRNLGAAWLARLRTLGRCVHVFTANVQPHAEDWFSAYYRLSVSTANVVVAVSGAVASGVRAAWGREISAVIPNGVDMDFFSREAACPIDYELHGFKPPFVLFVGGLERRKHPEFFIQLSGLLPELQFVMVGGREATTEGQAYIKLAQERPNVKYLGHRERRFVRDLMAAATALVFPSDREGLALTVCEAAAMGLPVIAQPKSSLPEIVKPGVTGWLMPIEESKLWADTLRDILGWGKESRVQFAEGARAFVGERYSWDVIAGAYRRLYTSRSVPGLS